MAERHRQQSAANGQRTANGTVTNRQETARQAKRDRYQSAANGSDGRQETPNPPIPCSSGVK